MGRETTDGETREISTTDRETGERDDDTETTQRDTREIQGEEELGGLGDPAADADLLRALLRQTDSKEKVLGGCCRRGVT
jgi:hypothetical protein